VAGAVGRRDATQQSDQEAGEPEHGVVAATDGSRSRGQDRALLALIGESAA
jgi:hypothetical protein